MFCRHLSKAAAVVVTALFSQLPAQAQDFPTRPIVVLIGQPAASGPDIMMRLYGEVIGKSVGQRIVIDNRTGAGGIVAATALVQAPPDGHTLLIALGGMHTIIPAMQKMPFDPINDFNFITLFYSSSGLLLVPAASPAKTFADLAAHLKSKPNGGSYATPGIGSPAHLMSALLQEKLGVPMTHIPYRGGGQVIMDLLADRFDFTFVSSVQSKPHILDGKVRALAVGGPRRIDWLPDVPTLAELGYGDVTLESWFGIAAPKATPKPITDKIHNEFLKASQDPFIIKRAAEEGATIRTGPTEEFTKLLMADYERLGAAVRRFGIRAD
jgi:tripartite-type tricarboxylate transporter receptor subunit TctC